MKKIAMFLLSLLAVMFMGCDDDLCMKVHHTDKGWEGCNFVFGDGSEVYIPGGKCTDFYVINDSTNIRDGWERIWWRQSYQTLEHCLDGVADYRQRVKEAEKEYEDSVEIYKRWLKNEIVIIGEQVWMSKNLNVKTEGSWCYEDKPENCEKYGRLYTWNAALRACPVGWHLPSKDEFKKLIDFAGGAGALKAKYEWRRGDWNSFSDASGFFALPAGSYDSRGKRFDGLGYRAYFWSASQNEYYSTYAYFMYLDYDNKNADMLDHVKSNGFSVRCLQDSN